jgi:hypothetical protein
MPLLRLRCFELAMTTLRTLVYAMWIVAALVSCASARDFMDILGVNSSIDKAADQMQALIDHAREAAFALEFQTNKNATERIDQINKVILDAIKDIRAAEAKTQADIDAMLGKYLMEFKSLETDIFANLAAQNINSTPSGHAWRIWTSDQHGHV